MAYVMWYNKFACDDAEAAYQRSLSGVEAPAAAKGGASSSVVSEIQQIRDQIKNSLSNPGARDSPALNPEAMNRISALEKENKDLRKVTDDLRALVQSLQGRVTSLEGGKPQAKAPAKAPEPEDEDDDDCDLFGSDDDDDAEAERIKEERVQAYKEKKAAKPGVIAKSSVVLDVKPWDDETDMKQMEVTVRKISMEGLTWGAAKLVPLAYGIKKLQIMCVVVDDLVSIDDLQEKIQEDEDNVQSVDIAAFNKI